MGHSKHLVTAPATLVRTAARGDERDRAFSVGVSPGPHVSLNVDRFSWLAKVARPRFANLGSRSRFACIAPALIEECDAGDVRNRICSSARIAARSSCHREFAFAEDHEIRACFQILLGVGAGFRAADDRLPARLAGDPQDVDDVVPGHQIGIHAEHRRLFASQMVKEQIARAECRVEDVHVEALGAQVRA